MKILIIIFCFASLSSFAQNLVPNNNFESYKKRPTTFDQLHLANNWYCPNGTTPDYFVVSVTKGNTNPMANNQDTNGYVGLVFRPEFQYGWVTYPDYYEYISAKLTHPLEKDKEYVVKCDVFFNEDYVYTFRHIGMAFSIDSIFSEEKNRLKYKPINMLNNGALLEDKSWVTICNSFKAQGGEKFIALGSFSAKNELSLIKHSDLTYRKFEYLKKSTQSVYLFIDNIIIEELNDYNGCRKNNFVADKLEKGNSYRINNINFEFSKSNLLASSYPTLDELANMLKTNPKLKIQINGYTDNLGDDTFNLTLSEKRAEAVFNYLLTKGIPKENLKFKGFGKNQPIADNNSEQGRAINRRVEFLILKK